MKCPTSNPKSPCEIKKEERCEGGIVIGLVCYNFLFGYVLFFVIYIYIYIYMLRVNYFPRVKEVGMK